MQANYVAQYKTARSTLAADNIVFSQNNKSCIDSAFAELFSSFQQSQGMAGNFDSMWAVNNNSSYQMQNQNSANQNRQVQDDYYKEDTANNIEQSKSKETEGYSPKESASPNDDANKVDTDNQVSDDNVVSKNQTEVTEKTQESGEEAGCNEAGDGDAKIAAALVQTLLESPKAQNLDLTEATRNKLKTILQELKTASNPEEQNSALAKLKEMFKSDPALQKVLSATTQLNSQLKMQDSNFMTDLKNMLSMADPNYEMKFKKSGKEGQIENETGSKSNLSSLESAATAFARQKLKTDQENGEKNQNNSRDSGLKQSQTQTSDASSAKNIAFSAREAQGANQKSEGSSFKKTMTGTEQRIDAASHHTKQGQNVSGAGKAAVKQTAGQETVIKNFQDVKALLDKQLVQVKETSSSSMSIKLNPQELGKINIQLELLENGKLQGKIFVENEITKNSLQQNAEALKEQIKAQGVSLESFEINLGSESSEQGAKEFYQQGRFDRQSEKSRQNAYSDFQYDEEMSDQLKAAISQNETVKSGLNVLV